MDSVWSEDVSVVCGSFQFVDVFLFNIIRVQVNAIYSLVRTQTRSNNLCARHHFQPMNMVWHGYGMEWKNSKVFVRAWKMLCQFDFRSFHLLTFWPLPLNNYYLLSTFSLTVNLIIIVQMLTMDALLFRMIVLVLTGWKTRVLDCIELFYSTHQYFTKVHSVLQTNLIWAESFANIDFEFRINTPKAQIDKLQQIDFGKHT